LKSSKNEHKRERDVKTENPSSLCPEVMFRNVIIKHETVMLLLVLLMNLTNKDLEFISNLSTVSAT